MLTQRASTIMARSAELGVSMMRHINTCTFEPLFQLQQTQSIMGHPIVDHRPDGSCFVLLPRSFLLNARELGRFPVCKCP